MLLRSGPGLSREVRSNRSHRVTTPHVAKSLGFTPSIVACMASRSVRLMRSVLVASLAISALLVLPACAPEGGDEVDDEAENESLSGAIDEEISDTWSPGVGTGVSYRRAAEGDDIAIFYGGYGASQTASQSWADETYEADLAARGVGRLYAVKGPLHADYRNYEIGNSKIVKRLLAGEGAKASRIIVVAHSSGAFVANEFLSQIADGRDVEGALKEKVVYFNLDGAGGPPNTALQNLAGAWAVAVEDTSGVRSTNAGTADANGTRYGNAGKGGLHMIKAASGVCFSGARWCLHMVCTNERPHNKSGLDVARDYTDFDGRPVQIDFLSRLDE